jgi:hypothetical protein
MVSHSIDDGGAAQVENPLPRATHGREDDDAAQSKGCCCGDSCAYSLCEEWNARTTASHVNTKYWYLIWIY